MPASLKLQEEYGSDLQVLFVECQGADLAKSAAFAWRRKWMGTRAMWSTERPVQVEGRGLPKFALLDVEGNVILSGNPLAMKKKIEKAIAEQVKLAKGLPPGTPSALGKTWKRFQKGAIAAAVAECDAFAAEGALAEPAARLRDEMIARARGSLQRARWMLDNGYPSEGGELQQELARSIKGCAELEKELAVRQPEQEPGAQASEIAASKALASVEKKMRKGKPFDSANLKALAKLAGKHAGTRSAERALQLLELAKVEF